MANNPTRFVMKQKVDGSFIQLLPKTVIDQIYGQVNSNSNVNPLWNYINERYTSVVGTSSTNLNNTSYVNIKAVTETDNDGHTKEVTLTPSVKTVRVSSATSTNSGLATAYDVQQYVGSFAGGIHYKGTVDGSNPLPTENVITGDLYVVAENGTYAGKTAQVGDFFIASVNGTTKVIEWQHIPINFTVEDMQADVPVTLEEPSTKTVIAKVDGKNITMSVSAAADQVSVADSESVLVATNVEDALVEIATEIDAMNSSYSVGSNVAVHLKQESGTVSSFSVTEKYAGVTSSKTGDSDTAIAVTNSNQLLKGKDAATLATFTNTRIGEEIAKLDAVITSSEAAVATVKVEEVDGKITDVVVTNISAGVSATTTAGSDPTISATTNTGAVTGADITTIKSYVDARSEYDIKQLDVDSYAQGSISTDTDNSKSTITLYGIKEVNGKISHGSDMDASIEVEGVYSTNSETHNYLATESTVKNAINALDVTGYQQMAVNNKTTEGTPSNGSIVISGIQEVDGKISASGSTTLNVDRGLDITDNAIGHTNSVTAQTEGLGSSENHATKVVTGLKFDAQGHITAAGETDLVAANIVNAEIDGLTSTNVQATMAEIEGQIKAMSAGMIYRGGKAASEIAGLTGAKVGDTYTITTAGDITIGSETKHAEAGDTVIIATVGSDTKPASVVVVERNLEGAVTNTGTDGATHTALASDKLVLGNGNDTVKTSTYGVSATGLGATAEGVDANILTEKATVTTIVNRINALDAVKTSDDNAVATVQVVESNGIITDVVVTNISAGVTTGTASSDLTSSNLTGAVTGADIAKIKGYVDYKVSSVVDSLDATVSADSTNVNITIVESNGLLKSVTVSEDYATVTKTKPDSGNTRIDVTNATGLVIGSDIATVVDFVDERISEEINKLDATKTQAATNSNGNLALSITEIDGKITSITGSVKTATADSYGVVRVAGTNSGTTSNVAQDADGKLTVGNAALTVTRAADGNSDAESASSFTADARTAQTYTFHASYTVVGSSAGDNLQNGDFWFDTNSNA